MAPKAKGSNCPDCLYYRKEVPVSTLLQLHAACDIPSEALLKIQEEEVKIRDNEAGILASQIAVGRTDWALQPQMWQYCAEKEDQRTYEIVELKNKDNDCIAFRQRDNVRPTQCLKCRYGNRPPDRYFQATARIRDPKLFSDMGEAIKKDFELEVMSGWVQRGMLPTQAAFQDWCSWYSEGGRCALCAYMNRYGVCPNYAPLSPEFDIHGEKATV
jgi:hypothetical protein